MTMTIRNQRTRPQGTRALRPAGKQHPGFLRFSATVVVLLGALTRPADAAIISREVEKQNLGITIDAGYYWWPRTMNVQGDKIWFVKPEGKTTETFILDSETRVSNTATSTRFELGPRYFRSYVQVTKLRNQTGISQYWRSGRNLRPVGPNYDNLKSEQAKIIKCAKELEIILQRARGAGIQQALANKEKQRVKCSNCDGKGTTGGLFGLGADECNPCQGLGEFRPRRRRLASQHFLSASEILASRKRSRDPPVFVRLLDEIKNANEP